MIGAEELTVQPRAHRRVRRAAARHREAQRARRRRPAGGARRVAVDPRRRDRRRRRRFRQRPAPARRGARRPARRRERRASICRASDYHATRAGDAAQPSVCAARGAAEERLRRAHERRRQSRASANSTARRLRPAAGGSTARHSTSDALRKIERYKIKTRSDSTRRSASFPAATCSAPCWRASLPARSTS